jgi:hypothetical protein
MARKMADCRRFPSESNCTLTIIGEEDNDELREQIRGILEPEQAYTPGQRAQEPMPG